MKPELRAQMDAGLASRDEFNNIQAIVNIGIARPIHTHLKEGNELVRTISGRIELNDYTPAEIGIINDEYDAMLKRRK